MRTLCEEVDSSQIGLPQKLATLKALVSDAAAGTDISPLLALCISRKEQIRNLAIRIVKTAPEHFGSEIRKAAYDALKRTVKSENPRNELSRTSLFYEIFTFKDCFVQYMIPYFGECSQVMKRDVLNHITIILRTQKIDGETVKQALMMPFAVDLVLFVVTQQSLISPLDESLQTVLNEQYEATKEAKFIIPLIPGMKAIEFLEKFDAFMELSDSLLQTFVFEFLYGNPKPVQIDEFLVELHKYTDKNDIKFQNAVKVFSFAVDNKQVVSMRSICSALDRVSRLFSLDMIFVNINKMIKVHPESEKIVSKRMIGDMIYRNVCTTVDLFTQLKRLINDTAPESLPATLKLSAEQFEDLLKSYPDLKDDIIEFIKTHPDHEVPEKHKEILGFI